MKFKHKTGFWDDTQYVEIDELGEITIVTNNGERVYGYTNNRWTYQHVLENVKNGIWVEIKD